MTEIVTFNPDTQVLSSIIQRYIAALGEDDIEVGYGYAVVRATTAHPCEMVGSAFYRIARLLTSKGYQFSITHREDACQKHGDDHCIYDIRWWEESKEHEEG